MNDQRKPQDPFSPAPSPQAAADELRMAAGQEARHASVKDAAVEKAGTLKDVVANRAAAIREGAEETATNFKDVAGEQWQDTQQKAKELQASLEDNIRANPTKAVLTAAAAGFVFGLIFRR